MHGHGDSVTGLSLSSEGSYLLSNSMDNTGRMNVLKMSFYQVKGGKNEAKKEFCLAEFLVFLLSMSLCSAHMGCSTICSKGKVCEDFPGQCSQL